MLKLQAPVPVLAGAGSFPVVAVCDTEHQNVWHDHVELANPNPCSKGQLFPFNNQQGKDIMLCTHFYMFNKLHDKKHPHYKPIPLITSYFLNPEQPSPFVTI